MMEHEEKFDPAFFQIIWEQQPNGDWDKVLYRRETTPLEQWKDKTPWIIDRYLESNVPEKEYFRRKLEGKT